MKKKQCQRCKEYRTQIKYMRKRQKEFIEELIKRNNKMLVGIEEALCA